MAKIVITLESYAIVTGRDPSNMPLGGYLIKKQSVNLDYKWTDDGDTFTPASFTLPAAQQQEEGVSYATFDSFANINQVPYTSVRYSYTRENAGTTIIAKDFFADRSDLIGLDANGTLELKFNDTAYYKASSPRPVTVTSASPINVIYNDQNNENGYRPTNEFITLKSRSGQTIASGKPPFNFNLSTDEDNDGIGTVTGSSSYYDYEASGGGLKTYTDYNGETFQHSEDDGIIRIYATLKKSFHGTIIWHDFGNYSQIRPASVTVKLYRNGSHVTSKVASGGSTDDTWDVNFPAVGGDDDTVYTMTVNEFPDYSFSGNSGTGSSTIYAIHVPKKHFTLKLTGTGNYGGYSYQLAKWTNDPNDPNRDKRIVVADKPFTAEGGNTIDLGTYEVKGGNDTDTYDIHYSLAILQNGSTQPQTLDIKTAHDTPQSTEWTFEVMDTPTQNVGSAYKGMLPKIGSTFGIVNLGKDPIYVQLQEINFVTGEVALATNDSISLMK